MNSTQSWNDLASIELPVKGNNLLLLDGNNLAYRFVGRTNYNSYSTEYIRTITSLAKSYNAIRTICLFDYGKSYYRKELQDKYKANREISREPEALKKYEEFFECLNSIIDNLEIEHYKQRGLEADDLISYFSIKEVENYDHIWIVSSDKDLYQLVNSKVSIFNLFSRREITEDSLLEDQGLSPLEFQLAKYIQGDKGDNIEGVAGIGEKRSAALAREYKTLSALLLALPIKGKAKYIQNLNKSKDILLLNEKLINLIKYHELAIKKSKNGDEFWRYLNE